VIIDHEAKVSRFREKETSDKEKESRRKEKF
jgi:hypothetical protein